MVCKCKRPRLSNTLTPLKDGGVYAPRTQRGRRHPSRRPSADDDDILHLQRLLVMWWPDESRSAWTRSATLIASAWVTGRLGPKIQDLN
jgi:hypothetical protein